jgi:hypothetical protein
MTEAFREQEEDPEIHRLSFEERLGLLVDRQWNWKHNQELQRRLINARLRGNACIENIKYRASRGLDRQQIRSLREHSGHTLVPKLPVYNANARGSRHKTINALPVPTNARRWKQNLQHVLRAIW